MADRYLSEHSDDESPSRSRGGSSRRRRKRRIRVTQNGLPDNDYSDSQGPQSPSNGRRGSRSIETESASLGYDDYLDDDYLDEEDLVDDMLDDDFEEESVYERPSSRRPATQVRREARSSRAATYEHEAYGRPTFTSGYGGQNDSDQNYSSRTSLRAQHANRPRMPQLPMRGGLSDLVGRGRVAMTVLMGLLAFVGYNVSNGTNQRSTMTVRSRAAVSRTSNDSARPRVDSPINLSARHDIALGRRVTREIIRNHGGLSSNNNLRVRVQQIGNRLEKNASTSNSAFDFHFDVLADDQSVASYDVPGGQVYLTTGLINQLTSDNEIAAIIAHEMAHVLQRHTVRRLANLRLPSGKSGGVVIAGLLDSTTYPTTAVDNSNLIREAIETRYEPNEIQRADELAVSYLMQSNIDPNALVSALRRVYQVEGRTTVYAAKRASASDRLAAIQQRIEQFASSNL